MTINPIWDLNLKYLALDYVAEASAASWRVLRAAGGPQRPE